jgi:hypothetical protein
MVGQFLPTIRRGKPRDLTVVSPHYFLSLFSCGAKTHLFLCYAHELPSSLAINRIRSTDIGRFCSRNSTSPGDTLHHMPW